MLLLKNMENVNGTISVTHKKTVTSCGAQCGFRVPWCSRPIDLVLPIAAILADALIFLDLKGQYLPPICSPSNDSTLYVSIQMDTSPVPAWSWLCIFAYSSAFCIWPH